MSLLYILFLTNTTLVEKIWLLSTLLCHLVFFIALKEVYKKLLEFLHIFVFVLPTIAIFLNNIYIKLLSLIFLILIQILWLTKKRCILILEEKSTFGYGDHLNVYVIFISLILAFQIGVNYTILKN